MPSLNAIIEGIKQRANWHHARHEKDGADEMSVEGLEGNKILAWLGL